jgi:hypothetical protein
MKLVSARRRKSEPDWRYTRDACATQAESQSRDQAMLDLRFVSEFA